MPKGLKPTLYALGLGLGLYSLVGFLIVPGIAERIVNQQLQQWSNVPAEVGRIEFNPFSLELQIWNLRIGEPQAEQIAFKRLYANLQGSSLWQSALQFKNIELENAYVNVAFSQDGKLNLSQLFKLPASEPASNTESEASEPFPLRIAQLKLIENSLQFSDLRPSQPVEFAYDSFNLELNNLSTVAGDQSLLQLRASGPYGSQIDWRGELSLNPLRSSGELELRDGQLKAFWPYVREAVPLELEQGVLEISGAYQLDLSQGSELLINNLSLQLADLALTDSANNPLMRLKQLQLSDSQLDLAKQQLSIGQVRSQGLESWVSRERNGQINWQTLFTPAADKPAKTESSQSQPWQIQLKDAQLTQSTLNFSDKATGSQPLNLTLAPLNISLKGFDNASSKPFAVALQSGINPRGKLSAEGQVQLQPLRVDLAITSQQLDLALAQPYLSPYVHIEVRSGLLDSQWQLALHQEQELALSLSGNAQIKQLHTLDTLKKRDLLKWHELNVAQLNYQHGQHLQIERLTLKQPYVRFIVNEDLSTNFNELVVASSAPAVAHTKPTTDKPLAIRIGGIQLDDGSANFADFSLIPPFATAIQQLNGQIGTLNNQSTKPAQVNIAGKVDKYAPVTIAGQLTPFDPLNLLDIAASFKNVELTTLTPYSGKFAGYRIRKGRLSLDLHYQIEQGQLNAENKMRLEDLQLGEKVDSKDAVDLPIRLAVALLKDPKGNIDIELPVRGNLNDPQFSVMPIVWQTLRNLVLRSAQAPFNVIAGLVGGSQSDLSLVPFAPGSSELTEPAKQTLDTLSLALQQRPTLRLEVEGNSARPSDGPLIAAQRLEREYQNIQYAVLQRRGADVPASAQELVIDEDDKPILLEGIYRARLKQQPPEQWRELSKAERFTQMQAAVIDSWSSNDTLLRRLAQARAASIKDYLVESAGLDEQRVYLIDASLNDSNAQQVPSQLHLGSL